MDEGVNVRILIHVAKLYCSWHTEDSFGSRLDILHSREKSMKKLSDLQHVDILSNT